ncbi:arginine decarboxylase [Bacillus canaveralius]|uniref:Arginine decarboxylase n=1 Tax=Bacillus canaveralius TaxID=1403243 RepID=A0A2N5GHP5_9BACI|nr:aminotransferase class I/II-fold pyridoxal phosphate-dependent enzyme [Bacillus canaveralius]PLR80279.1 arginine decarboxylase [Bacillus canaveralius]PLS00504.1 arginine decarboxylase [Bacillus canaveralius]
MDQKETPLLEALVRHSEKKPISLHVPGHKYGSLFPIEKDFGFAKFLQLDATELTGLDDLHSPEGVILAAERLLAELYGVKESFFLVNGSTGGNLAMILAAIKEDDIVLVQRNCHKSILNGIELAGGNPVFLGPMLDEEWQVAGGVSIETVEEAIYLYPHAKAIIVTYPNYYGLTYDLKSIINVAHQHDIPVLVDEAHGAHFIVGRPFPLSAVELGADITVQSAHKTLPAMTMGSFLHFNSQLLSVDTLKYYLRVIQSSSPSYPILASLDVARSYLASFNQYDLDYTEKAVRLFKQELSNIEGVKVLESGNGDLLKLTLQSTCTLNGFDIQKRMEQEGVFVELADPNNVLFVLPLLKQDQEYPFALVIDKLTRALKNEFDQVNEQRDVFFKKKPVSPLLLSGKQAKNLEIEELHFSEAAGQICAEMIVPYPPGIPLLYPGELIDQADLESLNLLLKSGARFQGGEALLERKIKVYKIQKEFSSGG